MPKQRGAHWIVDHPCRLCCSPFALPKSVPPVAESKTRVFEIRTYTTEPGKLPDLLKRFRDHTTKLFEKHGMTNIGYWVPTDEPRSKNTLIYILAHDSREAAKKSWDDFKPTPTGSKSASLRGGRQDRQQSRIGLRRPDRLLRDQIATAVG